MLYCICCVVKISGLVVCFKLIIFLGGLYLMKPGFKFKRVVLKLSGEALAGDRGIGIDYCKVSDICSCIRDCVINNEVQMGIVVGGGNFWRGRDNSDIDVCVSDQIGMVATLMNALYLREIFQKLEVVCNLMATIPIPGVIEKYSYKEAVSSLTHGEIVVFGGGTGNTHFSTDSAASLRAAELKADVLLKATMVDGVYNSDPKKYSNAVRYSRLSYDEVLKNRLSFMDSTATAMCKDNNIKVLVFNISDPLNIKRAILGESLGTLITTDGDRRDF